ncbi:hypothetical protein IFM12275_57010 [Nocardia sputorum]|uniref:Uncharacterized protein n=1 Tax=Nocardia sputorum TaxID=2984338 RepID=A0ABM8CRB1_9NOCA|nr:hypothetical protein IFM12275_57010 [Nocardia sputorum]BDT97505.1 hypothetical protein IFM12276_05340 [Nocardia sputorum]
MQGFPVHAVLAVVDVQVRHLDGQLAASGRIVGEELPEVSSRDGAVVIVQFPPCRRRGDVAAHVRREYKQASPRARARMRRVARTCADAEVKILCATPDSPGGGRPRHAVSAPGRGGARSRCAGAGEA